MSLIVTSLGIFLGGLLFVALSLVGSLDSRWISL